MKKKILIAIAALFAIGQGGWAQNHIDIDGLEYNYNDGGYYEISSSAALNALATYVNDGNNCSGLTFKVTGNITFSSSDTFTPIGYGEEGDGTPFSGTFDGQDKTISGITYSDPEGAGVGLFGYIHSPAKIKNVKLDNCSFTGNFHVGVIVGNSSGATNNTWGIYNCTVGSNVTVTAATATIEGDELPGAFAGGIIGDCVNMTVSKCISAAIVKGDEYVGGIAGRLLSSLDANAKERGAIDNCYFTGTATVTGEASNKDAVGARGPIEDFEGDASSGYTNGQILITLVTDDGNEDIKNATRMDNYNSLACDVTIEGRTLYKDGSWNTLCLPFSLDALTGTPLEGTTVMTLSSSSFEDNKLTLNFGNTSGIVAGKPYIIKWTKANDYVDDNEHNLYQPTFSGVTIASGTADIATEFVDFKGNYSPITFTAGDKTILYMGSGDKLYYPNTSVNLKAFRGYFKLNDITAGDLNTSGGVNAIILNFGDDSTGIEETLIQQSQISSTSLWYTLDGRLINGQPKAKGIYINNGKKVVIK